MIDTTATPDRQYAVRADVRPEDVITRHTQIPLPGAGSTDPSTADAVARTWGSGPLWPDLEPVELNGAEQEWCDLCSYDPECEPGIPSDVVDHSTETDPTWDSTWGPGPRYEVWHLACGHTVALLC